MARRKSKTPESPPCWSPPDDPDAVEILKRIIKEPEENTHRYVYADYLRERGSEWDVATADYILFGLMVYEGREEDTLIRNGIKAVHVLSKLPFYRTGRFVYPIVPYRAISSMDGRAISNWQLWDRGMVSVLKLEDRTEWYQLADQVYWPREGKCPPTAQPISWVHFWYHTPDDAMEMLTREYPGVAFTSPQRRLTT